MIQSEAPLMQYSRWSYGVWWSCSDDGIWWTGGGSVSSIEYHLSRVHYVRGRKL